MKRLLMFLVLLWGGGAAGYWYWNDARATPVVFRTASVERGDLRLTIEANGTIEPIEVVDVGAQVAGQIKSFGADPSDPEKAISYRSPVEEGTVLAHLDESLFKARVNQARAQLDRARADVQQSEARERQARRTLERSSQLRARGSMISVQEYETAESEFEAAQANLAVARSAVAISEANLEEAEVNLGYTTIRSPVSGVILDRRVNLGQTVVASLSAPSLFLIARDLSRLEIWASVNEADIGAIHPGQPVQCSVAAFPDETFAGQVAQIRLNASMAHNVVTYTVVIDVDNTQGKLLPYLTARVRFEVDRRSDVLLVPNAALRFRPSPQHIARGTFLPRPAEGDEAKRRGTLWVRAGVSLRPVAVRVGPTDGLRTEVEGEAVSEGLEVVVGYQLRNDADSTSPFLPQFDKDKPKR